MRPLENIFDPDPGNVLPVTPLWEKVGFKPASIEKHHKKIAQYRLNKNVPEDIVGQFETAKNLYLYAWFIYRFYPVSEFLALACLELALRERYEKEILKSSLGKGGRPSLTSLMRHAIAQGHIRNEGFKKWHDIVWRSARHRYNNEKLEELRRKELKSVELNYPEVEIGDIDKSLDYVNVLFETLPRLRNQYAHGTAMFHKQVLGTFEIVAEIINQAYPEDTKTS